ncbi:hypothetical protein LC593_21045 [Nostoc sp. CHAB 5844]|nr:hypothetical protein [Nostoc sp. CHAB 5844]
MFDTESNPISIRTAVSKAMEFVRDLYEDKQVKDILLEEIEFSESANQWLVTISFSIDKIKDDSSSLIFSTRERGELGRKYKIVHIDAQSGKPISMKIREL